MSKTSLHLQPKGNDEIHQNDGTGEVPHQAAPSVPYGHPIYYSSSPRLNIVHTAPGCKRIIVDPGYLESLHRPNVTLNFDTIERIVPSGVQLKTGQVIPLDVLIFGTGFSLVRFWSSIVHLLTACVGI
jgi:cation diffusion facilitator CzcD-associated flavoprotein CzcO